jgi:carbonic anhydrase
VKTVSSFLALSLVAACGGSHEPPKSADEVAAPTAQVSWSTPVAEAAPAEPPSVEAPPAEQTNAEHAEGAGGSNAQPEASASPAPDENRAEHSALGYLAPETSEHDSQSPINIVTSRAVRGRHKVKFHYRRSKEHVDNLGHTVKVTYDAGSTLEYDGHSYDLVQFHFHTPSEHLIDGVTFPMEMHLVHAEHDHPEHLLVVGVLFKEGNANRLLADLIANVPEHAGEHADKDVMLNARSVLKRGEGYYHYEGSLTTPPFSETVTWLVLDQPHDASAEQIEALNRIEGNNARHIQSQNARRVDHWR